MKKINKVFSKVWKAFSPKASARLKKSDRDRASGHLMKSRPLDWEPMSYVLLDDQKTVEKLFQRFCDSLKREVGRRRPQQVGQTPPFRMETGILAGGRRYVYLQPWNEIGWLVEQAQTGWRISRADKRVDQETFLREGESFDVVNLYVDEKGHDHIKVSSLLAGDEGMSWPLYERWITEQFFGPHLVEDSRTHGV